MNFLLLIVMSLSCLGESPVYWSYATGINDRHEFYKNNEQIISPKDSWQTLFSVVYLNRELHLTKDCVFYRVPGNESGILKIKSILASQSCEDHVLEPGDKETKDILSLQYAVLPESLVLEMTFKNYKNEKWEINIGNEFIRTAPKMLQSSAEYKSPKIIFLAPVNSTEKPADSLSLVAGSICHQINDDCQEIAPSRCGACAEGWYEIPNGCMSGPKYCGRSHCGQKNLPACRRGMKWQREELNFDCRVNSSFAYCAKGLSVQCEGRLAFCH